MGKRKCKCGGEARYLKKNARFMCDDCAEKSELLVKCDGEAHSNPFIDNCYTCMPRWGLREVSPAERLTGDRFAAMPETK